MNINIKNLFQQIFRLVNVTRRKKCIQKSFLSLFESYKEKKMYSSFFSPCESDKEKNEAKTRFFSLQVTRN